jgi:hypothetical protein
MNLPTTADDIIAALRDEALSAHARGDLAAATKAQTGHIAALRANGRLDANDMLFQALLLFQAGEVPASLSVIDDALRQFPNAASLHENRGVLLLTLGDSGGAVTSCLRAIEAGGATPNAHDCLADASGRLGRLDDAARFGRMALEAKDQMFCAAPPIMAPMPTYAPTPFNPHNAAENIISYTLWGDGQRYIVPLIENLRLIAHLFPGWTARVHVDASVPQAVRDEFAKLGAQVVMMALPPGVPGHRRLLWRFAVVSDPAVRRFLIRDADSILTVKERVAVDAWLASSLPFHIMRDYFTHTDLILAGMWGGVGGILPPAETLLSHWRGWRAEGNHIDQDLLSETVWPSIRRHSLIHDSVFTGCLGSVAFPPFGALPPGFHVGENSFLRFVQNG